MSGARLCASAACESPHQCPADYGAQHERHDGHDDFLYALRPHYPDRPFPHVRAQHVEIMIDQVTIDHFRIDCRRNTRCVSSNLDALRLIDFHEALDFHRNSRPEVRLCCSSKMLLSSATRFSSFSVSISTRACSASNLQSEGRDAFRVDLFPPITQQLHSCFQN